ncbi:phage tail assembly protein [Paenibacillus sp. HGF5]|uniref:phage tail assembly protein n=1 Tax=Paenibacillus sp. HGF5 TaxID=908341 RepID=UPI000681576E|nr:phage tail assembly protein [Paenibacillus sp. HGF5]
MTNEKQETQVGASSKDYKLIRPITFEGDEIKSLNLDFECLGGTELMNCAKLAQRMDPNEVPMVRAASINYQVAVAARAAGVTPELIQSLKAKDFTQVTQLASNFLITME